MKNSENEIIKRIGKFRSELGIPVTAFAKNVGISANTYYKWIHGYFSLSTSKLERIDNYLSRYGF